MTRKQIVVLLLMSLGICINPAWSEEYNPVINPAEFVAGISSPYLQFTPGATFTYEGDTEDGPETILVEVTNDTRLIMGVTCTVVRDRVWLEGELIEDTFDWYAEHQNGDVWYFGEDSTSWDEGVPSTEGSWEAGVDGALPGILMKGNPQIGDIYRQEYYEGEAEDMAEVVSLTEFISIDFGDFDDCLRTKEWTPLEPGFLEYKFYAPGVGLLLETDEAGEPLVELVPEPATLALLALSAIPLLRRRK